MKVGNLVQWKHPYHLHAHPLYRFPSPGSLGLVVEARPARYSQDQRRGPTGNSEWCVVWFDSVQTGKFNHEYWYNFLDINQGDLEVISESR